MSLEDLKEAIDDGNIDPTSHMEWAVSEIERLRSVLVKAQWALQPFSDCVFNDNGGLTISPTDRVSRSQSYVDAYFAYKAIRNVLSESR